jgi:hypothetical protein
MPDSVTGASHDDDPPLEAPHPIMVPSDRIARVARRSAAQ